MKWPQTLGLAGLLFFTTTGIAYAQDKPLTIGTSLPMSGVREHLGAEIKRGMDIWLNEANASGVKFVLDVEDNGSNVPQAIEAARKLAFQDHAAIIVGACCETFDPAPYGVATPYLFPLGPGFGLTPAWARFRQSDIDRVLRDPSSGLPGSTDGEASYGKFPAEYRKAFSKAPSAAALFGYAAMQGFGATFMVLGGRNPTLATLQVLAPTLPAFDPFVNVTNPPDCKPNCRPHTCGGKDPCPCQPPPCD